MDYNKIFEKNELIPTILQDAKSGQVLMLAYSNQEAFEKTMETKTAWFWSRSRKSLWNKGETSGNFLHVVEIYFDCDLDTILIKANPVGPTCHTGENSCFFNQVL